MGDRTGGGGGGVVYMRPAVPYYNSEPRICGLIPMGVVAGANLVIILQLSLYLFGLIDAAVDLYSGDTTGMFILPIITIGSICVAIMFLGVRNERQELLLPYLILKPILTTLWMGTELYLLIMRRNLIVALQSDRSSLLTNPNSNSILLSGSSSSNDKNGNNGDYNTAQQGGSNFSAPALVDDQNPADNQTTTISDFVSAATNAIVLTATESTSPMFMPSTNSNPNDSFTGGLLMDGSTTTTTTTTPVPPPPGLVDHHDLPFGFHEIPVEREKVDFIIALHKITAGYIAFSIFIGFIFWYLVYKCRAYFRRKIKIEMDFLNSSTMDFGDNNDESPFHHHNYEMS